jgi:signal transduction histidine kinase
MKDPEFQEAFEEQNKRDYLANARFGSIVSIPLNLSCSVMDYFMYPEQMGAFFQLRVACGILTALVWFLFNRGLCPRRVFGITWFMGPLLMILWMIYTIPDPISPYYAGLNIILLAMGLISPWTYKQNFAITGFVLAMYVLVSFARPTPQPVNYILNNTTFLFLTAAFVVLGSRANLRQRFHEFSLRWELDRSRKEMEESNQKLMELDQIKGRFFANISHELRTPLTLMISPLETIQRRYAKSLDADTQSLLQTMHSNGLRLLKLINDLLDLVRLDSGVLQVRCEAIRLDDFLRGLASAASQIASDKKIQLITTVASGLNAIMADRDKMEKIILNLQFNALKFTPAGGRIEISASREGEDFLLRVSDTGIGIPAKNLPNMFERFFQVDSSSRRKFQGVGIGLALVKELTELHGGTVSVESEEGKGTTFTIRMPYLEADLNAAPVPDAPIVIPTQVDTTAAAGTPAAVPTVSNDEWLSSLYNRAKFFGGSTSSTENQAPEPVASSTPSPDDNRPTVVIADDEPDMLRFLKSQLVQHYRVIEAKNGQEAIDRAIAAKPDLILLDMMMPEKDGLQACRELRDHPATKSTPIVMLTARADEETKIAALNVGVSDFLPKPFSSTELHVRLRNLVDSHGFQRELGRQNQRLEETIEELKETESMLVQTEKLASLGRLSAGIIHEINNPLNFATTGLYTLRKKGKHLAPEQQEDYTEVLKDVEDGLGRVKTIVSDLRQFTHPELLALDDVEVAEVVRSAVRFVSHEFKDQVDIKVDLPDKQMLRANKNKLIQVLLNLLQNSMDAINKKTFEGERPSITVTSRTEAGRSFLVVHDNGPGIPPEVMDKIFDPFFTTKDVGEGMGLGLSISHRIVEDMGGRITVKSERGKYCEFTLEFPNEAPIESVKQF